MMIVCCKMFGFDFGIKLEAVTLTFVRGPINRALIWLSRRFSDFAILHVNVNVCGGVL